MCAVCSYTQSIILLNLQEIQSRVTMRISTGTMVIKTQILVQAMLASPVRQASLCVYNNDNVFFIHMQDIISYAGVTIE